jgi:hypothetical protein
MRLWRGLTVLILFVLISSCAPVADSTDQPAGTREARRDPAVERMAQRRTVADIRLTGTAMYSWLTDQIGAGAAGQTQTEKSDKAADLKDYPPISRDDLVKLLVPKYLTAIPEKDGWGHPYEYYLNAGQASAKKVLCIRSPGRDGVVSGTSYTESGFEPEDFDQDIVWADGYFIRFPQRKPF